MCGRARPAVVGEISHHFRAHWILFHISDGIHQVRLFQHAGERALLPEVTDKLVLAIEALGMPSIQPMKDQPDRIDPVSPQNERRWA